MRICLLVLALSLTISSKAQLIEGGERSDKNFQFLPVPYVNYSRSLEFSYGLLPLAMYNLNKKDTISPSSISGALAMATTNGTWFVMGFSKFYLMEDTYRITVAGGMGNVNFQFYPDIPFLPEVVDYSTGADFFMFDLQRKIVKNMYGGLGYVYSHLETEFDIGNNPTEVIDLHGVRFIYQYDKREDVYYPRGGFMVNVNYNVFPDFLGNTDESQRIELDYNHFFAAQNERDVWATRAYVGFGIGELSFNQQFIVGNTDLRGYSQGEYRGDQLYAVQGEYRWNITSGFGLVGFAGVATVTGSSTQSSNGILLPAVGTGFRINVFPKHNMNIGLDFAAGKGDWAIEFRIGEAF